MQTFNLIVYRIISLIFCLHLIWDHIFLIYESKQFDHCLFLTLIRCFCFINSAYQNSSKYSFFFTGESIWMSCFWIKWIILPVQKNWKSMLSSCSLGWAKYSSICISATTISMVFSKKKQQFYLILIIDFHVSYF